MTARTLLASSAVVVVAVCVVAEFLAAAGVTS